MRANHSVSNVRPHYVKECGADKTVLDDERVEIRAHIRKNGTHYVFFLTRIRSVHRHNRFVARIDRSQTALVSQRQDELLEESVTRRGLEFLERLLAQRLDPDANIGSNEMHQTESRQQLKLVNHESRVREDEVHLREREGGLEDGVDAEQHAVAWRGVGNLEIRAKLETIVDHRAETEANCTNSKENRTVAALSLTDLLLLLEAPILIAYRQR